MPYPTHSLELSKEESRRPTSNFGKMKPFLLQVFKIFSNLRENKINATSDHLVRLVGIADQLGDSPIVWFITFLPCLQHLCVLDHWEI
ncbi:hypothetical protein H5410_003264 [Solanum commersonii]|uniref:Uncharacterized protein n=1 Tax=Solanum commersonii TaxID=4109 RepID=A0A9J6B4K3_SOLCO|nr:hypothetical protein H5410_003264 [Solanum commersonii]